MINIISLKNEHYKIYENYIYLFIIEINKIITSKLFKFI